ncbi:putative invertase inhibitor [Typha angustifolia]|uniref:putative invertase inhibitor n=1 Tax=Typha angustifolia TaxID=59011 RepID=UPI003C2F9CEE
MRLSSLPVLFLAAVLLGHQLLFVGASNVEDVCRAAASSSPNINFDFCVTSLQADPGSGSADKKGLAVIAAELASKNATSTKSRVQELLNKAVEPKLKNSLDTCLDLYSDMIPNLSDSISAIRTGRYSDAKTYLSSAFDAPGDCENAFSEEGIQSPITKENSDSQQLSVIALSITNTL